MKVCTERGHMDLSFNASFIKIELEIITWWRFENKYLPQGNTLCEKMFNVISKCFIINLRSTKCQFQKRITYLGHTLYLADSMCQIFNIFDS